MAAEIWLLTKEECLMQYSLWSMTELYFHRFEVKLQAFWVFCFDDALHLEDAYRYLRNHKRSPDRINQYVAFHFNADSKTNNDHSLYINNKSVAA